MKKNDTCHVSIYFATPLVAALKRKRVEADERPPAPAPPPAPVRTHDSMGTEWHSIHILMLGEYIPIYKSSVRDASSMVAEAECELDFPIRASVVSCSVSLAGLETTLLCLELCPMGWK